MKGAREKTSSPCPHWCWQGFIQYTNYRDTALLLHSVFVVHHVASAVCCAAVHAIATVAIAENQVTVSVQVVWWWCVLQLFRAPRGRIQPLSQMGQEEEGRRAEDKCTCPWV